MYNSGVLWMCLLLLLWAGSHLEGVNHGLVVALEGKPDILPSRRRAAAAGEAAAGDPGHVRLVHVGRILLQRVGAGCGTPGWPGLLSVELRTCLLNPLSAHHPGFAGARLAARYHRPASI